MPAPKGRPSVYSEELALSICAQLAEGKSLKSICEQEDMPSRKTVYEWLLRKKDFSDNYTRAREEQADTFVDEIINIADNEGDPQKARVRIDARKWVAGKMRPKKYSEKLDLTSSDGSMTPQQVIYRLPDNGRGD